MPKLRKTNNPRETASIRGAPGIDARLSELSDDPVPVSAIVVVDTDVGALALHADDKVMTPFIRERGLWEADEATWLRSVLAPGQTVVDCGANVGYFSVLMAREVGNEGTVVAVEPEGDNLRLLRHNLWRNDVDNVRLVAAAASDHRGVLALRRNTVNRGDHQVFAEGGAEDVLVPCLTIDELMPEGSVDVVKIDTQGADHFVVRGMSGLLERSPHAQLLVEYSLDQMFDQGVSAEDVLDLYRDMGRPVSILEANASLREASNDEVIAAARARQDHWINIVIGPRGA